MTDLLRVMPTDRDYAKDKQSRVMGVALGYKLLGKIVELTPGYAKKAIQIGY